MIEEVEGVEEEEAPDEVEVIGFEDEEAFLESRICLTLFV